MISDVENGAGVGLETSILAPGCLSDELNGSTNAELLTKVCVKCASVLFFSVDESELLSSTATSFFAVNGNSCLPCFHFLHVCGHSPAVCFHMQNRNA